MKKFFVFVFVFLCLGRPASLQANTKIQLGTALTATGSVLIGLSATGLYLSKNPPVDCGYCCPANVTTIDQCTHREAWKVNQCCPGDCSNNETVYTWDGKREFLTPGNDSCIAVPWSRPVFIGSTLVILGSSFLFVAGLNLITDCCFGPLLFRIFVIHGNPPAETDLKDWPTLS